MWGKRLGACSLWIAVGLASGCGDDDDAGSDGMDASSSATTTTETTETGSATSSTTDDTADSTTSSTGEPGSTGNGTSSGTTGGAVQGPPECLVEQFVNDPPLPDYGQYGIEVGQHCRGTNHQDIMDVDRVVFLGDSITVGTPPSPTADYYRVRLAEALADRFALDFGGSFGLWSTPNAVQGTTLVESSGDFWSCSEWGARNDDILPQSEDCFPPELSPARSLVVMTMGGNDLSRWAKDFTDGVPLEDIWVEAERMVQDKRDSIEWLTDAERFPNGNTVVFANVYEFTDGTGDVQSCDLSGLAGFDNPVPVPEDLITIVEWIEEQYAKIAVETGTDFIFMYEEFCGHGFNHDDPSAPCYRGPDAGNWFDLTCIHPNPTGHGVIADMFLDVIDE